MANYTLKDLNSLTWHFWWKCGWPLNILGPLYITTIYCIQQSSTLSTQTFTNLLENGLHLVVYCDKLAPTWKHVSDNCACLRNDSQAIPEWTLTGYNHDYHLKKKKREKRKTFLEEIPQLLLPTRGQYMTIPQGLRWLEPRLMDCLTEWCTTVWTVLDRRF